MVVRAPSAGHHQRLVAGQPLDHGQAVHRPPHEGRGREDVGPEQGGPDHGDGQRVRDRAPAVGVDEVPAAPRGARGRDPAPGQRQHGEHPGRVGRVLDADPPRQRVGPGADGDVAARVDADVAAEAGREVLGGTLHRPALDQPGRVEAAPPGQRLPGQVERVERPAGQDAGRLAQRDHLGHQRVRVLDAQLAAVDPADLAVRPVGREQHVDGPQLVVRRLDPGLRRGDAAPPAAEVDADGHPHHLLDPGAAGGRGGPVAPVAPVAVTGWPGRSPTGATARSRRW